MPPAVMGIICEPCKELGIDQVAHRMESKDGKGRRIPPRCYYHANGQKHPKEVELEKQKAAQRLREGLSFKTSVQSPAQDENEEAKNTVSIPATQGVTLTASAPVVVKTRKPWTRHYKEDGKALNTGVSVAIALFNRLTEQELIAFAKLIFQNASAEHKILMSEKFASSLEDEV